MHIHFSIKAIISALVIAVLFLSFVVIVAPSVLTMYIPTAKAQSSSMPSTVWSEFPSFEPQMLTDYPSAGYLTWNTTYGLYTMDKSFYWFSFKDRYGVQQVSQSVFWINTTATIDIAKIANVQVTVKNNTVFQVKYSARYKGGGLNTDTVIGNFTVTHTFSKEQKPKISVQFVKDDIAWSQGGLGDFNIVWVLLPTKAYLKVNETSAVDYTTYTSMVKIKETTAKEDKKCEIGSSANPLVWTGSWLLTFWDDVEGVSVLYAGVDKVFGSKGITVVFPTNDGQIDPSVVGTSTNIDATQNPFQRKSFYANGRFWVFYYDGSNMVYRTSTDGSTWTVGGSSPIRAASSGYYFSVWFDGTYLHYAYASGSIYYRRGTPNSDGSITWSAAEQAVSTTYNGVGFPMVSVDSNGYVWVGYQDLDTNTFNTYPYVIKSGNNDGTWGTTPTGFPYQLSTTSSSTWRVSVVPLTTGKMLAVYACDGITIKAKRWNGSAWGTEVATTSAIQYGDYHSAVAQGDDVHLVFLKKTTYDILYVKYTYSSNSFGAETTLKASATSSSAPVISIDTSTNNLYVFAAGWISNHIYYIKYTASSGTWGSWTDWIDESSEVLTGNDVLTCFYQAYGNYIGLVHMTKTASPYNVKFAFLVLNTPPTIGEFQAPTTVYANKYFFLNATINDADGIAQFVNATIEINGSIILKWDAITNIFSKTDPNNYCAIDSANSFNSTISGNSTAYKLSFKIKLYWNYTEGNISVLVTNTKVFDNQGASGSNSYVNLFYFEDDLIVYSASVNDNRINPSQSITFSGKLYYENTTTPPEDVSGITAKVDLGTTNKGSTTTIGSDGSFSMSFSGEGTVGSYSYTVYSVTDEPSVQNQTINVAVDRMKIILKGANDTRVDINAGSRVYFNATWEYDNALFQGDNGTLYINGTAGTWDATNKYWYIDVTHSSVGAWVYQVSSITDNVYGISTLNDVVGEQQVIWERVKVESSGVLSNRINNVTSTVVYFVLKYEYDSALITDGTVLINGTSATYNSTSQRWELTVSNTAIAKNVYYVSSVSGNTYGITVINHAASYPAIIFDKDKMDSFAYSGGTLANVTFRLLSEYYSNTLNNTNLTLNVYLNDSLLDSISATSNDTGLVFVSLTHNICGNGTLTFNLTDSDGVVSYLYSCPVEVYVESVEVFSIDPMILYTGDSLTITMSYKPKANINGTYISLSNVYWKALIYTDKYYGYYNFNLYNGSFANALESRVELMPIALSEGSYMLNMTFYIRGSDVFLGCATSPYFVVKSRPVTSGGAPSTVVKLPLTVVVRDYKGGYAQGIYVVVIDQYNATVWEGTTDNWGTAMTTLNPGTYNVTVRYDNETLSDTVTLSDEPVTKEFTLPGLAITPVTVTLDSYSILWLGIGLIGAVGAVILERKEKTAFAVALGLVTIGAVLHSLLVITHQMPPYFTVPPFDFSSFTKLPSLSLPSISLPQLSLDMQTITLIATGIIVPTVAAYAISQRGGTHKRRVRVGKFGEERRKRVWK
jgi:hypothetical protein